MMILCSNKCILSIVKLVCSFEVNNRKVYTNHPYNKLKIDNREIKMIL